MIRNKGFMLKKVAFLLLLLRGVESNFFRAEKQHNAMNIKYIYTIELSTVNSETEVELKVTLTAGLLQTLGRYETWGRDKQGLFYPLDSEKTWARLVCRDDDYFQTEVAKLVDEGGVGSSFCVVEES